MLDALDECDSKDYRTLSHLFNDYYSENSSQGKLKFLITSRPYDIIESLFRPMSKRAQFVRFDGDERYKDISRDIDLVIDARINDFAPDFKLEDKMKIANHLKSRGTRTYLWLHLTLSIIEEKPSRYKRPVDIEALLSEIPSQVSEAYEKILQRSKDERMTITLLQILLTAKRDLTEAEANYALTMALAEPPFHTQADIASQCWQGDFKTTVKNLCGLIVNIYDNRLSFIHLTAREFLLSKGETDVKWEWKGRFQLTPELGQPITQCCITYLLLDDWLAGAQEEMEPETRNSMAAFPFLEYAVYYWATHFKDLGDTVSDSMKQQVRRALAAPSRYKRVWDISSGEEVSGWTDLASASRFGLYNIVEYILATENVDVNAWSADVGSALSAAVQSGQVKLVDLLISRGADVNSTNGSYYSPLTRAIQYENEELVNLLLLHGADARVPDTHLGESPVQKAAENAARTGNKRIFLAVLSKYVDLDTAEGIETAVVNKNALAAGARNSKYLEMLLDVLGRDMHLTQHMLEILMSEAESERRRGAGKDTVASRALKMALDRRNCGFSIKASMLKNVTNSTGKIELLHRLLSRKEEFQFLVTEEVIQTVAEFGDPEKMKLLLEHFDTVDGISRDILLRAASNRSRRGRSAMLQLLLDCWKGTIENGEDILLEAIFLGDKNTVECLLSHPGFHFHVSHDVFLELVSRKGWEEVSKTILERTGLEVLKDDYLLGEAARCATSDLMRLVLDRLGNSYVLAENVLCEATWARDAIPDKLRMLLEWQGNDTKLTPAVFVAAARGRAKVLDWLLETRSQEVEVTEELIEAVVEDDMFQRKIGSLQNLLCLKPNDVARLAPFALLMAARHHNMGVLWLLADEGLITPDMFTEEALLAMLARDKLYSFMDYFMTKLLEQTTIGAKLMERIAMHKDAVTLLTFIRRKRPACFYITEGMIEAAAKNGQEEVLHYLSRWKAEAAAGDKGHSVAAVIHDKWFVAAQFRSAAVHGNVQGMQIALDKGADPNLPNLDGVTPINAAALLFQGVESVLFLATRQDVDVNAADKDGTTPLHNAVKERSVKRVRALLEAGADPDTADSKGVTPYMLVMGQKGRRPEIVGLFRTSHTRLAV